jgi:hypothetical protein
MTDFRKRAEECLRAAGKMRDRAERIAMIRTACDYMDLADEAANIDCADRGKSTRTDKWFEDKPGFASRISGSPAKVIPYGIHIRARMGR